MLRVTGPEPPNAGIIAHPLAQRLKGGPLVEADVPDVPLLLVDGSNLLFRSWFGFPARIRSRDKTRDLTGAFGFFALLRVAVRDEITACPEIAVVFDGELGSAERRELDPAYKAHRCADEAALAPIKALPDVKRGLDALKIDWIEVEDAEADDVIATLVHTAPTSRDILIMSGDRDMYQLVTERVLVLNTAMRAGQRIIGPKEIEARYGVPSSAWCCRTGLVGDPSDGIKGIRGIGPVTAARLLEGGLSLENLPASGRLTGRTGQLVLDNLDAALRCRDLARMRTDIPIPRTLNGRPSPLLPAPADVVTLLDLW
jgi:DNA polymerase-1